MDAQLKTLPSWLDIITFDTEVAQDAKPEDVVFVDVGGGNGSQCAALKQRFPSLQGRIVLQDRPTVLESALGVEGLEIMSHDLLTEQPVKLLHSYDDDICIQILQMHLPALYNSPLSRLYIDEKVLPNEQSDVEAPSSDDNAALSLTTTAGCGAQERKEGKWRWLLDQAGMEVVEIRKFSELGDSVIIAKRRYQDQWR
ncbi:hypothetical protein SLS59_009388 [Nothophoma quercina]|uniref:O-methyltransferase C-terminal domain-containing protein n=1 Tax=Nothophoma quercina TaxID=749835 RepID=A0ABR3QLN5_9PLEO